MTRFIGSNFWSRRINQIRILFMKERMIFRWFGIANRYNPLMIDETNFRWWNVRNIFWARLRRSWIRLTYLLVSSVTRNIYVKSKNFCQNLFEPHSYKPLRARYVFALRTKQHRGSSACVVLRAKTHLTSSEVNERSFKHKLERVKLF